MSGNTEQSVMRPRQAFKAPATDISGLTPFAAASYFFDQAAQRLGLSEAVASVLRTPYREIRVQLPLVKDDNNTFLNFTGYRVLTMVLVVHIRVAFAFIQKRTKMKSEPSLL